MLTSGFLKSGSGLWKAMPGVSRLACQAPFANLLRFSVAILLEILYNVNCFGFEKKSFFEKKDAIKFFHRNNKGRSL
jgi:hypothetical protein